MFKYIRYLYCTKFKPLEGIECNILRYNKQFLQFKNNLLKKWVLASVPIEGVPQVF